LTLNPRGIQKEVPLEKKSCWRKKTGGGGGNAITPRCERINQVLSSQKIICVKKFQSWGDWFHQGGGESSTVRNWGDGNSGENDLMNGESEFEEQRRLIGKAAPRGSVVQRRKTNKGKSHKCKGVSSKGPACEKMEG